LKSRRSAALAAGLAALSAMAIALPRFSRLARAKMMRDVSWLARRALRLIAQEFGGAAVQRLAAALEQALVGRVLD
jgi:hypothetical protein